MTTKHHVIAAFQKNPNATSYAIADQLDCDPAYVRTTLMRAGLRLKASIAREDYRNCKGVRALGYAAKAAGLTVGDIERIAEERAAR